MEGCAEQGAGVGEDLAEIALPACNLDLRLPFVRVGYANKRYHVRRVAAKMISSNTHACNINY